MKFDVIHECQIRGRRYSPTGKAGHPKSAEFSDKEANDAGFLQMLAGCVHALRPVGEVAQVAHAAALKIHDGEAGSPDEQHEDEEIHVDTEHDEAADAQAGGAEVSASGGTGD